MLYIILFHAFGEQPSAPPILLLLKCRVRFEDRIICSVSLHKTYVNDGNSSVVYGVSFVTLIELRIIPGNNIYASSSSFSKAEDLF